MASLKYGKLSFFYKFFVTRNLSKIVVETVERLGSVAFHIDGIITNKILLVEYSLVRAQKAPFDISITKTNMEYLTVCAWIGIVAISSTITRKVEVSWNFLKILPNH